jgi:hypothetical protein
MGEMAVKTAPSSAVLARANETDDASRREQRLCAAFAVAEKACELKFDEGVSIWERADAIVRGAKEAKLDPELYAIAWFVRKTANQPSM